MRTPLLPSLATRCRQPEIMDQPDLDEQSHRQALAGLARINWISRSGEIVWPLIYRLAQGTSERPLRVLDVACGGGDVALAVKRRAEASGLPLDVAGCDMSPTALQFATRRADEKGLAVDFFLANAITQSLPDDYDIVMCSLFLHHLEEREAVSLLAGMAKAAKRLLLVNDLIRSRFGYLMALSGTRLLTRSHVVHVDGPLSVRGAFRLDEVTALAETAGLKRARLSRHWPERFLLSCLTNP